MENEQHLHMQLEGGEEEFDNLEFSLNEWKFLGVQKEVSAEEREKFLKVFKLDRPADFKSQQCAECHVIAEGYTTDEIFRLLDGLMPDKVTLHKSPNGVSCYFRKEQAAGYRAWLELENRIKSFKPVLRLDLLTFNKPSKKSKETSDQCLIQAPGFSAEAIYQFLKGVALADGVTLELKPDRTSCYLKKEQAVGYEAWLRLENRIKSFKPVPLSLDLLIFEKPPQKSKETSDQCLIQAPGFSVEAIYQFLKEVALPDGVTLELNPDETSCYLRKGQAVGHRAWRELENRIKSFKPVPLRLDLLTFKKPSRESKETSDQCLIQAPGFSAEAIYQFLKGVALPDGVTLELNPDETTCYLRKGQAVGHKAWWKLETRIKSFKPTSLSSDLLTFKKPSKKSKETSDQCLIQAPGFTAEAIYQFLKEMTLPKRVTLGIKPDGTSCYLKKERAIGHDAWRELENRIKSPKPTSLSLDLLIFKKPPQKSKETSDRCLIQAPGFSAEAIYQFLEEEALPDGVTLEHHLDEAACYLRKGQAVGHKTWWELETRIKSFKPVPLSLDLLIFGKPSKKSKETSDQCFIQAPGFSAEAIYQFLKEKEMALPDGVTLELKPDGTSCYLKKERAVGSDAWLGLENRIKSFKPVPLSSALLIFKKPSEKSKETSDRCLIQARSFSAEAIYQFLKEKEMVLPDGVTLELNPDGTSCYLKKERAVGYKAWQELERGIKKAMTSLAPLSSDTTEKPSSAPPKLNNKRKHTEEHTEESSDVVLRPNKKWKLSTEKILSNFFADNPSSDDDYMEIVEESDSEDREDSCANP